MATGLQLLPIAANADGLTAVATLQGSRSGALQWFAAPEPDGTGMISLVPSGSGPYTLTFPLPDLWWVWVQDANGRIPEPEPVWLLGIDSLADDIGQHLADLLNSNRKALEVSARRVYPSVNLTGKPILYGYPGIGDVSLVICVAEPSWTEEWIAAPNVKLLTYSAQISVGVLHNDRVTELPVAMKIGGAITSLLNRPRYNTLKLSSGLTLFNCYAQRGSAQQVALDTGRFASEVFVTWTGQASYVAGGPMAGLTP